jgi:hypothetical protein
MCCPFCTPCCCRTCDPWRVLVSAWAGLAIAIRNEAAARWLLP